MYVIEILNSKNKSWVASHLDGDPPRTLLIQNAQIFTSVLNANKRLEEVKLTHPYRPMVYKISKNSNFN